jgi:hypothetical protein
MDARLVAIVFGLLVQLWAAFASAQEVPERYPTLDDKTATAMLVVATLAPGKEYPKDDEPCGGEPAIASSGEELDSICIRFRTPFWMHARVRWSLVGNVPPGPLIVSSASHYKTPDREDLTGVYWLLPLITDGVVYVTYDRQRAALVESRRGELYLLLWQEQPPEWLPCSVESLREEVSAADFAQPIGWPREALGTDENEDNSRYLHFTASGVEPRYGISMSRLRAHLAGRPVVPGANALDCVRE